MEERQQEDKKKTTKKGEEKLRKKKKVRQNELDQLATPTIPTDIKVNSSKFNNANLPRDRST